MVRTTHSQLEDFLSRRAESSPRVGSRPVRRRIACDVRLLVPALLVVCASGLRPATAQSPPSGPAVPRGSKDDWRKQWQEKWLKEHGGGSSAVKTGKTEDGRRKTEDKAPLVPDTGTPAAKTGGTAVRPGVSPTNTTNTGVTNHAPTVALPGSRPAAVPPAPAATAAPDPKSAIGNRQSTIGNPQSSTGNSQSTIVTPQATILSETKADLFKPDDPALGSASTGDHTQDNPMAAVGDAWKMVAYLIPMLLVILGSLNLLKRFQERAGRLPGAAQSASRLASGGRGSAQPRSGGLLNALWGSFHLNNARQTAGRNIRLVESLPIGNANVHLLEVRGRLLLLGASAANVHLLAEFEAGAGDGSDAFRDLLHAAAADMDALDYAQDDIPAAAAVATLEDLMRETGQAVSQRARHLRALQEVEMDD